MKLYFDSEWILALLIFHIIIVVLIICAGMSFSYFCRKFENWFMQEIIQVYDGE